MFRVVDFEHIDGNEWFHNRAVAVQTEDGDTVVRIERDMHILADGMTISQHVEELNNAAELVPVDEVVILPAVSLWERLTEAEAEQVNAAMATQPFRTRQIFLTANTFRSDHELWPLLVQMATDLFGEARAAELLA